MAAVVSAQFRSIHHPRRHAAAHTDDYVFSQLIPYIGNKRKLLGLIAEAVEFTGVRTGSFVDLFSGSTVVARWAKQAGYRVLANDWEPYSHTIAHGTVGLNRPPAFTALGGVAAAFNTLNGLPGRSGYVTKHLCPANDDHADPTHERMFFTRANGRRIDAIREQLATWLADGMIDADEHAYVLASLIYATSYASNTSGVFKAYHHGWGGRTGTALYRIRGTLTLSPPLLCDNGLENIATRRDAHVLAGELPGHLGGPADIVYLDPPYNQHPYGSNYHVLNTVTLWDRPAVNRSVMVDGKVTNKSAIRTDWRTERRSAYNSTRQASDAFASLVESFPARWLLVSYSTDGNIPLERMLSILAQRGQLHVFAQRYKRYRVSTQRMSAKSHNVEFVAAVDCSRRDTDTNIDAIVEDLLNREAP
jgi:adenine-specific DNA-methyltransferase